MSDDSSSNDNDNYSNIDSNNNNNDSNNNNGNLCHITSDFDFTFSRFCLSP